MLKVTSKAAMNKTHTGLDWLGPPTKVANYLDITDWDQLLWPRCPISATLGTKL